HDDDVREELLGHAHRLAAGFRLAHNLDIVLSRQQCLQSLPHDCVVVGQQYRDSLAHMVGSRASGWPALCRADPGSVPIPAATAYRVFTPYGGARPGNELAPARI